jgi:hypothetical protein
MSTATLSFCKDLYTDTRPRKAVDRMMEAAKLMDFDKPYPDLETLEFMPFDLRKEKAIFYWEEALLSGLQLS